ncbi:DNRLRE domain-containing protein [Spongiactinospora sp. 9N601]|uniref:DNRLRE domain-containing protein n=1 Tax=Spongiactinospora sp. 9N601 TaxID=3375149 RepID=UPI0037B821C7
MDKVLGDATAKAVKTGKRVPLPSRYTETMKVWANTDGKTLHAELSTEPVQLNFPGKDGKRSWRPIDTTIVAKDDGTLAAKLVKTPLTFGGEGATTLVTAKDKDGTVTVGWNRKLPKPTVDGNEITYRDAVAEGADLVLTARPNGFAQDVVLRTRPRGPIQVTLPVTLPKGSTYSKAADGRPQLKSAQGTAESTPLATQAIDAKAAEAPEQGRIGKVDTSVTTDASGKSALVLSPDAAFLADPSVTYPVVVPMSGEWVGAGDSSDTFVSSVQYPNSATLFTWLRAGKSADGELWRTYLRYVINGTDLDYATIHDADLRFWNYHASGCGTTVGVGIVARRLTSAYHYSTLTWANQPSSTGTNAVVAPGGYSDTLAGCSGSGELYHSIQHIVQEWANGTPDHGLMIRAATEGAAGANWRQYRSDQYTGSDGRGPVLFVDYEPAPKVRVAFSSDEDFTTWPTYDQAVAMAEPEADLTDQSAVSLNDSALLEASRRAAYEVGTDRLQPAEGTQWSDPDPDVQDTTVPTVVSVSPSANAQQVPVDTTVRVTFDQEVWDAAFTFKDDTGAPVDGTAVMDPTNTILTFTPKDALRNGITYTADVRDAADLWDNVMDPLTWSFSVGTGTSLAARWTFDEGTGRVAADSSSHGHDAMLMDTADWTAGRSGHAVTNVPSAQARAAASRKAVQWAKEVEVPAETTESSITYALKDGRSYRTEIASGPVRARRGDSWVPIDTSLVERNGMLQPKALSNQVRVAFSTGGTRPFAKMATADGRSYALRWPTSLPRPTVKGAVATYSNAAGKGADLVVTVLPSGFRHDVVLRERPGEPLEIRIGVETGDLTVSRGRGGRLLLKDKGKKLIASAAQPVMWDSRARGRLPLAKRVAASTDVVTKNSRTELVVKPDQGFLTDAGTVYPVRVAAAVTLPLGADVDVSTRDSDVSPALPDNPYMLAGTMAGGTKSRVHLQFDTTSLQGSTVTDARLSMTTIDAQGCGPALANGIQVARLTGAWSPDNMYWAGKPTFTTEDASTNFKGVNQDCATWPDSMEWNVTGIAQDWAAGAANHGLVLKSPGEADVDNFRVLTSSEDVDFNVPPKLTIIAGGPASQPAVSQPAATPTQTVDGTTVTTSLTPQLAATVVDPAGGNLTGEFEIEHDPAATGQGTGQIWVGAAPAVASGGRATVNVPAGKLADGWKIRWRARAVNAAASTASAWSDWQALTVDTADPVSDPSVDALRVDPSKQVNGTTVTSSLTPALLAQVNNPIGGTLRAEFEVEHDPAETGQGTGRIWAGAVDDVASSTQAIIQIPAGMLTDGWKIRWRARAVAGQTSSPWAEWQEATVDVVQAGEEPLVL